MFAGCWELPWKKPDPNELVSCVGTIWVVENLSKTTSFECNICKQNFELVKNHEKNWILIALMFLKFPLIAKAMHRIVIMCFCLFAKYFLGKESYEPTVAIDFLVRVKSLSNLITNVCGSFQKKILVVFVTCSQIIWAAISQNWKASLLRI